MNVRMLSDVTIDGRRLFSGQTYELDGKTLSNLAGAFEPVQSGEALSVGLDEPPRDRMMRRRKVKKL